MATKKVELLPPSSPTASSSKDDPDISPGCKKKHHRRARRRRHFSGQDRHNSLEHHPQPEPETSGSSGQTTKKRRHQVYLRPTNGPLLNAPRNSTQFIIDDHEHSNGYFNFENDRAGPAPAVPISTQPRMNARHAGQENLSPDDDTFWAEYSERDFQSVYETAHQEEIAEWDRKKLYDEIQALERRQKDLVNILARLDPEIYLQKLQSELLTLQEANRGLKEEQRELDPALPDSSTQDVEPQENPE